MSHPDSARPRGSFTRWASLAALLLTALTISPPSHAWAESWESIRHAARNARSIEADFVQTRKMAILKKPIVSRGTISFRQPSDLRWEYASPLQSVLIAHDGKIARYIRSGDAYTTDSSARLEAMRVVLSEINLWLAGDFNASKTFKPSIVPGPPLTVVLVPIEPALRDVISRIVLSPGEKPGTVDSIEIHEDGENVTRIQFSNVRTNTSIPDSRFARPQ